MFDKVHNLCPNTSFLFARLVHKSKFRRRRRLVQTKSLNSSITVRRNMSNDVYNQSLGCFYQILNNISTGQFLCLYKWRERSSLSRPHEWLKLMAFCQTPGWNSSYSLHLHSRSLKQSSKDCLHLVEALGSAIWPHLHWILDRQSLEKLQTSDVSLPGWISQVFACHMSSVILTDIILTVLETSECFLSK